jgi:hypothetical protein
MLTRQQIHDAAKAAANKICRADEYEDSGLGRGDIERLTKTIEEELIKSLAVALI